ncbi:MAG: hypothetical protein M3P18_08315, partial [Actinomycetota bacterium]|nr:hypothetical protein [Actinomycetota bacterium]
MADVNIAIVTRDPMVRILIARAFDHAPESWTVGFCDSEPPEGAIVVSDHPRDGEAVVFDPAHPEQLIPEVHSRIGRLGEDASRRAVVVTGVGGSGVTTVALHLGRIFGRHFDSCFLDLDRSWSCADRLGLEKDSRTWADIDDSEDALRTAALPVAPGLEALVAPPLSVGADVEGVLQRALDGFERIVVDLPYVQPSPRAIHGAHAAVVVLSPTIPHARRAHRIVGEMSAARIAVVTNRLGRGGETTRREIEAVLGRGVTLELP